MRYLKLYESFEEIHEICKKYKIKNYTINSDGSIDVDAVDESELDINDWHVISGVNLWNRMLTKIPLKFGRVNDDFYCSSNELTSLEGSPVEVNGNFYCSGNLLTSFKGSPKTIRGCFFCQRNNIKSFEYFPNYVNTFICSDNPIYKVWILFLDTNKIELLNDFDIFRDEDTEEPAIIMDRLNDFLTMIGKKEVKKMDLYKNI